MAGLNKLKTNSLILSHLIFVQMKQLKVAQEDLYPKFAFKTEQFKFILNPNEPALCSTNHWHFIID